MKMMMIVMGWRERQGYSDITLVSALWNEGNSKFGGWR